MRSLSTVALGQPRETKEKVPLSAVVMEANEGGSREQTDIEGLGSAGSKNDTGEFET
jgi:hypothetical protein